MQRDDMDDARLSMPWRRRELILYLEELASSNPRALWAAERRKGLVSSIDQVFHFFFDDNDFDDGAIGETLLNELEVAGITDVRIALKSILADVGDGNDAAFTEHASWRVVREAASNALLRLGAPG
jgi:hypothetical protein